MTRFLWVKLRALPEAVVSNVSHGQLVELVDHQMEMLLGVGNGDISPKQPRVVKPTNHMVGRRKADNFNLDLDIN